MHESIHSVGEISRRVLGFVNFLRRADFNVGPAEVELIGGALLAQEKFEKEILPALEESTGRKNRLSLPRLEKIVVNMGVGSAIAEKKHMAEAVDALTHT